MSLSFKFVVAEVAVVGWLPVGQLGKLREAELKLDELILARSGRCLAQIRASLQAVSKMAVMGYLFWTIAGNPCLLVNRPTQCILIIRQHSPV